MRLWRSVSRVPKLIHPNSWTKRAAVAVTLVSVLCALAIGTASYAYLGGTGQQSSSNFVDLQKGLIGQLKMDGNARDSTPYSYNGVLSGSAVPTLTTDRNGATARAYGFDGVTNTGSFINLNNAPDPFYDVAINQAKTISVWFKSPSTAALGRSEFIFTKNWTCIGWYARMNTSGAVEFAERTGDNGCTGPSTATVTSSAKRYDDNNWHLLTGTINRSTFTLKLFIDGVLIGSDASLSNSTSGASFGARLGTDWNNTNAFKGSLDDFRIYNRELSTAEITALNDSYESSVKLGSGENGLMAWWKLDGNQKDSSPYSHNGSPNFAITPTYTTDRKGASNSAQIYNGANELFSADTTGMFPNPNFTVSAWVRNTNKTDTYVFGGGGTYRSPALQGLDSNGSVTFFVVDSSLVEYSWNLTNYFNSTNSWLYMTIIKSGSTISVYRNGQLFGTYSGAPPGAVYNDGAILIGGSGNYFKGSIDDFKVYNRALSATEITSQYANYNPQIKVSDLQKGLIASWGLNNTAKDATPYSNNGTLQNAPITTTDHSNRASAAYAFNGTNQYISVPNSASLNPTSSVSAAAWFKTSSLTPIQGIVCKDADATILNCPYELRINPNTGNLTFWTTNSAGTNVSCATVTPITANTWHHMVGTYDGATMKLYIDGNFVSSNSQTAPLGVTSGNLYIGQQKSGFNRFFTGSIDDVRIWNRALSAQEVSALYASTR